MAIVDRIKRILLNPKGTWPEIDAEAATPQSIYVPYVVLLAGLSALASFIGFSLVGVGGFGVHFRVPLMTGLMSMLVGFALSLVMVFVIASIVNALAPTFGGSKSTIAALKVVAYGSTAGFLGGLFNIVPALGMLGLLAALYSVYLVYTGLPVLMKCPPEKALPYTGVVIACGIVAMLITGAVTAAITPMSPGGVFSADDSTPAEVTIKTPDGELKIDPRGFEEMGKRMEAAGKQMEAAEKSGDADAAAKAAAAMAGALAGMPGVASGDKPPRAPLPVAELKSRLPETLAGLTRKSFQIENSGALGVSASTASAVYGEGSERLDLEITDTGGLAALTALAGWGNVTQDRETDREIERVYKKGQRTVHEEFRKDGSRGEMTVLLANGVIVEAKARGLAPEAVRQAIDSLRLEQLEALK